MPSLNGDPAVDERLDEVVNAYIEDEQAGLSPDRPAILKAHPDLTAALERFFTAHDAMERLSRPLRAVALAALGTHEPDAGDGPDRAVRAPREFGDYVLLDVLGVGGMGVVYRALHRDLKREVALKQIIAGPLASEADVQRFRNEAEAAASLHHPNIVPIHDVGEHQGQRFLTMRLIEGGSLAACQDRFRDDPRAAARLMAVVAGAVHHAHQRGVLHRDLKPSNILLGGDGQPHVTDFGLARRIGVESTLTGSGAILGSPPYMAPEQAEGRVNEITTATDVYGLGAVLYALMAGRPPFRGSSPLEVLDQVRATAPESPRRTNSQVDRDLETICLKCLEKEPARRYSSAAAVGDDLERWLAGKPVQARRTGSLRRVALWVRRHPWASTSLASGVIACAVGLGIVVWQWRLTEAARRDAEVANGRTTRALAAADQARQQAEAVKNFLVSSFRKPDPRQDGRTLKVVDLLDQASAKLAAETGSAPKTKAEILDALGQTYQGLGTYDKAVSTFERALELRKSALGRDDSSTIDSMNNLGAAYLLAGRTGDALPLYLEARRLQQGKPGPEPLAALTSKNGLALAERARGRLDLALPLFEELLLARKARLGPEHPDTVVSMNNLALAYRTARRPREAIPLLKEVVRLRKTQLGPEHTDTIDSTNNLALVYGDSGRDDLALPLCLENLRIQRARLGPDHPGTAVAMGNLASVYWAARRLNDAIPLFEEVLRIHKLRLGQDHPMTLNSMANLAVAYRTAGRAKEALPLLEEAVRLQKIKLGPDHPDTLFTLSDLAGIHEEQGDLARAESLSRDLLAARRRATPVPHPEDIAVALTRLGSTLMKEGKPAEAEPALRECLTLRDQAKPDDWSTFDTRSHLGACLLAQKRYAEAEPLIIDAYEGMKAREPKIPPVRKPRLAEAAGRVVSLYEQWGQREKAAAWRTKLGVSVKP